MAVTKIWPVKGSLSKLLNYAANEDKTALLPDTTGLQNLIDRDQWILGHHLLIWHGRRICHAIKPECEKCPLDNGLCGHCVEK